MRTIELSPLYRSFIGCDHLASRVDAAKRSAQQRNLPPYNIELLGEDKYQITMAVAGFRQEDIAIEVRENNLLISAKQAQAEAQEPTEKKRFLHQGISQNDFEHNFQLGDHVKVLSADIENGLLHIHLERVLPEAKRPRKIEIGGQLLTH